MSFHNHHSHSAATRRLDEYYKFADDVGLRQHPAYSGIMLSILVGLLMVVAAYGAYQVYQYRQCTCISEATNCATDGFDEGDMQVATRNQSSGDQGRTAAQWSNPQVEMTSKKPHGYNDYVSMQGERGVAV
jgi:hypothetical protein